MSDNLHELLFNPCNNKVFYLANCKLHSVSLCNECDTDFPPPIRGPAGPTTLRVGNTVYVDSVFGNDVTGALQDEARPYLTLSAAAAAVKPGYQVIVRPGTYTVTSNLATVNNVSWHFPAETFVDATVTVFNTTGLTHFSLTGEGVFRSDSPQPVILLAGEGADIAFRNILPSFGVGLAISSGTNTVHGNSILSTGSDIALNITDGVNYITLDRVEASNAVEITAHAISINNSPGAPSNMYSYIAVKEVLAGAGAGIFYAVTSRGPNLVSHLHSSVVGSDQGSAIFVGAGRLFATVDLVVSGGVQPTVLADGLGVGAELQLVAITVNGLTTGPVLRSVNNSAIALRCKRVACDLDGSIEMQRGGNISMNCDVVSNCSILGEDSGLLLLTALTFLGRGLTAPSAISVSGRFDLTVSLGEVQITTPVNVSMFLRSSTTGKVQVRVDNFLSTRGGIVEMTGDNVSDFQFGVIENNSQGTLPSLSFRGGQHTVRWNRFNRVSDIQATGSVIEVFNAIVNISGQFARTNTVASSFLACGGEGSLTCNIDRVETGGSVIFLNDINKTFDLTYNSLLTVSDGSLANILGGRNVTLSGLSRVNTEVSSVVLSSDTTNLVAQNLTLANTDSANISYSVLSFYNAPYTLGVFGVLTLTQPLDPLVSVPVGALVYQNTSVR